MKEGMINSYAFAQQSRTQLCWSWFPRWFHHLVGKETIYFIMHGH
jgi:hypothetical protein